MNDAFDPYHKWLGIPPDEQPPDHYRLLGIARFETDPDVIQSAADRQMSHVRTHQIGPHSAESQRLLNELASALRGLLDPEKKASYDVQLRTAAPPPWPALAPSSPAATSASPVEAVVDDPLGDPSFSEQLRGSFRYLFVQCRRLWLYQTKYQGASWRLGVHVYETGQFRDRIARLYDTLEILDRWLAQSETEETQPDAPRPSSRSARWLRRCFLGGRSIWIRGRRTAALRTLGRTAYAAAGVEAGPRELTEPMRDRFAQLSSLRKEAERLTRVPPGHVLSARRMAWMWLALLAAGVILLSGFIRG
jgi:hypothetical protein